MIQRESGGNLAEMLDNIAAIVRARLKLLGEVRTLSAEGRMSAWILGAAAVRRGGVDQHREPEFMTVLWTDPIGLRMVGGALVMMVFGVWWMRRIIQHPGLRRIDMSHDADRFPRAGVRRHLCARLLARAARRQATRPAQRMRRMLGEHSVIESPAERWVNRVATRDQADRPSCRCPRRASRTRPCAGASCTRASATRRRPPPTSAPRRCWRSACRWSRSSCSRCSSNRR